VPVVEGIASSLGLLRGEVVVVDSDPRWPEAFARLADRLGGAVGGATIEHVGSTAVAGLRAKPILDVALGLPAPADVGALHGSLAPAGLEFRGDLGSEGGLLFVLEDRPDHRLAHVHAVALGGPEWEGYLAFRDRLRRDASARAAYEELKDGLARRFPHDRRAYTAGKQAFIEALLADEL
jgi:GrpB-like predicted nucleotidyltransferase (UPF0157 family)